DDQKSLAEQSIGMLLQEPQFNFENNVDYRIAKNLTKQRELEVQLGKSKALQRLSGFVNYTTSAFDNEFVFFDSETSWYQSCIFGISMEVPIFSSLQRSARTQQAKLALDQAKTDFTYATQQIRLELDRAQSNFEYAIENYHTSEENLKLAQGIEKKNRIKYREGISSSFELRQAQIQLYTAQQEYINSMKNVIDTKVALETVINAPDLLNNNTDQN